ncbi:MAG: hypothetical protein ACJ75J_01790 [Cytophagaceae bacterium]
MKLFTLFIFTACLSLISAKVSGQVQMGYYGIYSKAAFKMADQQYRSGFGGSFEVLSPALLKKPYKGFQIQAGSTMSIADQSHVNYHILLDTPDSDPGTITYNNTTFAWDGVAKFVYGEESVKPYFDVFLGTRSFNSKERIESDKYITGYQKMTVTNLANKFVFDMGASGGLLFQLSPNALFDLRVSYATSPSKVNYVNLSSVSKDGNAVNYSMAHARPQLLIFRVGFIFILKPGTGSGSYDPVHTTPDTNYSYPSTPQQYQWKQTPKSPGSNSGGGGQTAPKPLKLKPNVPKT